MVQIARGATVTDAAAGTETTATTTGMSVRQLAPYGPEWAWVATLAPPFAIEGHSLRAFLEHTAAEEGWTLRYANAAVAEAADRILSCTDRSTFRREAARGGPREPDSSIDSAAVSSWC
jgi:hypothetical protein